MTNLFQPLIYLDTNCVGARGKDNDINELDRLFREEKITIETTETQEDELSRGKGYSLGLNKISEFIQNFDKKDSLESQQDQLILEDILLILWGKKNKLTIQQESDGKLIAGLIRYGGQFFVTNEKNILLKSNIFEKKYGIKIRNPKDCLHEIKDMLDKS